MCSFDPSQLTKSFGEEKIYWKIFAVAFSSFLILLSLFDTKIDDDLSTKA